MTEQKKFKCPCCQRHTLESSGNYDICECCGWEDDPTQSKDPEFEGGANEDSLKTARRKWRERLKAGKAAKNSK